MVILLCIYLHMHAEWFKSEYVLLSKSVYGFPNVRGNAFLNVFFLWTFFIFPIFGTFHTRNHLKSIIILFHMYKDDYNIHRCTGQ